MIIGIEGPALAGKSTIASLLTERAEERGLRARFVRCFAEVALSRKLSLPPLAPTSMREESDALEFFIEIDDIRRHGSGNSCIDVLDRTGLTLLAHVAGLRAIGQISTSASVPYDLELQILERIPSKIIYLDVSFENQLERYKIQSRVLPYPLLDAAFNREFRRYSLNPSFPNVAVISIDADRNINDVLEDVWRTMGILQHPGPTLVDRPVLEVTSKRTRGNDLQVLLFPL